MVGWRSTRLYAPYGGYNTPRGGFRRNKNPLALAIVGRATITPQRLSCARIRSGILGRTWSQHEFAQRPKVPVDNETSSHGRRQLQGAGKSVYVSTRHDRRTGGKCPVGHVARLLAQQLGLAESTRRTVYILANNKNGVARMEVDNDDRRQK